MSALEAVAVVGLALFGTRPDRAEVDRCCDCDHVHLDDDGPRCGTLTVHGACRCTKAPEWAS